ncbi:MAG: hypothetical protein ABIR94_01550 [Rubrivivax sp.]
MSRRSLLAGFGGALSVGSPFAQSTQRPTPPGVLDAAWIDATRQRRLPLRIRWPDGSGPHPLLLFSHGLGGSRLGGAVWGQAWRAAGFVVIHLQHPGSDSAVWVQGHAALRAAATAEQLIARVADVKFVLDEVQRRHADAGNEWARVRLDAIGVAGHSFGAQTVAALAGRRYPLDTGALADDRPRAFMAFSPSLGRVKLSAAEAFDSVTRPFMVLTGSHDGDPFGAYADGGPRWKVFEGLPTGAKAGLWLDSADHFSFAGQAELQQRMGLLGLRHDEAVRLQDRHHVLVAAISTAWWQATLLGDEPAALRLKTPAGLARTDRWVTG